MILVYIYPILFFFYHLNQVYHFLLIIQSPVNLIVVTCSQIDHNMFITEEEHHSTWIIQFIHLVKIGYFCNINLDLNLSIKIIYIITSTYQVNHCKIFNFFGNTIKNLVHLHTSRIPIMSKTNDYNTILF